MLDPDNGVLDCQLSQQGLLIHAMIPTASLWCGDPSSGSDGVIKMSLQIAQLISVSKGIEMYARDHTIRDQVKFPIYLIPCYVIP